jgi:hypothetical protein
MAMKWQWWRSSVVEVLKLRGRGKRGGEGAVRTGGVTSFNRGRGSAGEVVTAGLMVFKPLMVGGG